MRFKTRGIKFSPIKEIQGKAEERGAVSLAQGIPRFLLPRGIRQAAVRAVEEGKADFYGPPRGIGELRKKISERHLAEERIFYDPEAEILVTAGALQGLSATLLALLSPGDELIIPTPTYFPFLNLPMVMGIKPVFVPLQGSNWEISLADLKKAITAKTKAILLCHPNNPTGTVYSREELAEIIGIASKHDLFLIVDEVYRYFVYELPYVSLGEFHDDKPRIIRLMSFSKAYSLSGWRVGYLIADREVAEEILKVHEMMVTASASLPAQYAALSALSDFPDLPHDFAGVLSSRRERMHQRLRNLSSIFKFSKPQGAYYFLVRIRSGEDDISFAQELLEKAGVAVVPGSTFGPGGEEHLRLSFAAREKEIEEAFDLMEVFFE